jgi:hypothetical protein
MIVSKGKPKGIVHTMDISFDDIRAVFFPKDFYEKYKYLGSVPGNTEGPLFQALEPLVIFLDYKAKPKWCPRWVLRFLHLFGNDNSVVRIRNQSLHRLSMKLTKGILLVDYKTKWTDYDLRITIYADGQCYDLPRSIESKYHNDGLRLDLFERIKDIDPNTKFSQHFSAETLRKELDRLEEHQAV